MGAHFCQCACASHDNEDQFFPVMQIAFGFSMDDCSVASASARRAACSTHSSGFQPVPHALPVQDEASNDFGKDISISHLQTSCKVKAKLASDALCTFLERGGI